ncbi:hypothetical protein [uncultured Microbacterium sp.]|jgi:hypothetical protein|uniref:hypothetical protein n=1 Tax=uncultured Microbacterium sp. TaxID=191216 RepID=UPI0025D8E842|nr:hypothetical protein [uncultured Microbacterium sp.]
MRGKVGLVIGLAAGYVLGTRAGHQRYEQIKTAWLKVWELDPVQKQVERAKDAATSAALALPKALWTGAVKVTKAATGAGSPGTKLDRAIAESKRESAKVEKAAQETAAAAKEAVDEAGEAVKKASTASRASSRSTGTRTAPKTTGTRPTSTRAKKADED